MIMGCGDGAVIVVLGGVGRMEGDGVGRVVGYTTMFLLALV